MSETPVSVVRLYRRSRFTMATDVRGGTLSFGLLGAKPWLLIDLGDRWLSSLDNSNAVRIAATLLPTELWPQFALPLLPNDHQDSLF